MKRLVATALMLLIMAAPAAAEPLNLPEPAPVVAILHTPPAEEPDALTLTECYQLALKRSEQLAIHAELIKEAEARFGQALSTTLPHVSFVSTDLWQDGSGESSFTLRHRPERGFNVTQTLFAGFKEFAALAGSRQERRQRREERARAEQLLLVDVANAFHLLLEQREDLAAQEAIRIALVDRLEHSDVIVYLIRENLSAAGLEGKTTFIAARGNVRYLRIGIAWERAPRRHVAAIAHELRHAVEIADAPWVVDELTLEREYERIGCARASHFPARKAFETAAAMEAGNRAWKEFDAKSADD